MLVPVWNSQSYPIYSSKEQGKKLLVLWWCFVDCCARDKAYFSRIMVNALNRGHPAHPCSLWSFNTLCLWKEKILVIPPVTSDHARCALLHNPLSHCLFPGCKMLFHSIWLIREHVQQFMMPWVLVFVILSLLQEAPQPFVDLPVNAVKFKQSTLQAEQKCLVCS